MSAEFKCPIHDFTTSEIKDWQDHLRKEAHEESGTGSCIMCGKSVAFGVSKEQAEIMKKIDPKLELHEKPVMRKDWDKPSPVLCDDCKKELVKA